MCGLNDESLDTDQSDESPDTSTPKKHPWNVEIKVSKKKVIHYKWLKQAFNLQCTLILKRQIFINNGCSAGCFYFFLIFLCFYLPTDRHYQENN